MKPSRSCFLALLLSATFAAQTSEPVNTAAVEKVKAEAARQSQVIEIARTLTNVHGARLTNSANIKAAGEYARKKLVEWKLDDVRLETWNFGNGWTNEKFSVKVVSDPTLSLRAYPKPWTPGTNAVISGEAVEAIIQNEADFEKLRGKLRGKFAMILPPPPEPPAAQTAVKRFTDDELKALTAPPAAPPQQAQGQQQPQPAAPAANADAPEAETGFFAWVENALSAPPAAPTGPVRQQPRAQPITRDRVTAFYFQEGVAAMIEPAPVRNGAVFAVTATGEPNAWKKDAKTSKVPPQIIIAADQYSRIIETIRKPATVTLEVDIRNTYQTQDPMSFNVVADIKGTDKADELVVLGAPLDSWHIGKGATDNAAGVAVVMEAVRLLKVLGLPMRRTVRLGLWSGEEEGMLGSRAFIDRYFVNRPIAQLKPGHSKLSAYFNVDNGTGAIRGVYMQGNTAINPIFEGFMAPLKSLGMTTLSPRSVGGTDHLAFDNAGLPGFQFIQDPIEYDSRTHHSDQDTFERLIGEDLTRNAAIVASFVYLTANRDEPLPRKPLPRTLRPAGSPVP